MDGFGKLFSFGPLFRLLLQSKGIRLLGRRQKG